MSASDREANAGTAASDDVTPPRRVAAFDDPQLMQGLGPKVLKRRGVEIHPFKTGRDALDHAADHPPSLCLTPLELPDMEARELATRLHEMLGSENISVVALIQADEPDPGPLDPRYFAGAAHLPLEPKEFNILMGRLLGVHLRQAERFPIRVRVFSKEYIGTTLDLSSSGMLVRADEPLNPGTVVELRFALPGGAQRMTVTGRVVRVDHETIKPQVAIALRFDPLTFPERRRLESYIETLVAGRSFEWKLETGEKRTTAVLVGRLKDSDDLLDISSEIEGPVDLDLRNLKRIDQSSLDAWRGWLRGLGQIERPVRVSSISYKLALQAVEDPDLLRGCRVENVAIAHVCDSCGAERAMDIPVDGDGTAEPVACPVCGEAMEPDDPMPDLGFLQ